MVFSLKLKVTQSIPDCAQLSRMAGRAGLLFGFASLGLVSPTCAQAASLRVGLAQVDISTRLPLAMGGYGTFFLSSPRKNGEGIHDPLYASAVVLESAQGEVAALVSVDAVGLSSRQISRIEARLRDTVDPNIHLIVAASHTHHSPDTLGLWGSLPRSGRDSRYSEQLETGVVQSVRDAFALRTEAKLSQRTGRHANDSTSSDSPENIHDGFVNVAFYAADDGRLLGTLTQWAAHPTVLGMDNNALSSDYIGAFRKQMERFASVPHLYFNGAIGKVYPLVPAANDSGLIDDLFPQGDRDLDVKDNYKRVSTVGWRLANAVWNAPAVHLSPNASESFAMCHVGVSFPVDNKLFKLASNLRVVETRIRSGRIQSRVSTLSVGGVVFASLPGELFPKLIKRVPEASLAGRTPVWLGMGQDWLGYFVDSADYENPNLKYWTDLSVHREASQILLDGLDKALQVRDCVQWTDDEE
ncbi:MAG: hypothetical protein FJY29_04645 [Betaproteobacteria bacterium]|nr:hypothetical protein [Betaproteobacteria bacterium]